MFVELASGNEHPGLKGADSSVVMANRALEAPAELINVTCHRRESIVEKLSERMYLPCALSDRLLLPRRSNGSQEGEEIRRGGGDDIQIPRVLDDPSVVFLGCSKERFVG